MHTHTHTVDPLPPPAGLPPGVYFIRDNVIRVTRALVLPEVGVVTGITSNWLITDDSGTMMDRVSGGTIVMEFYC